MMEHQPSTESLFELQVDFESGNYLKETARWSKFIAIVCFVGIGLFALGLVVASTQIVNVFTKVANQDSGGGYTGNVPEGLVLAMLVIGLGIFVAITLFLYRFASMVRQGVERQDQVLFNKGVKSLKWYFIVMGIFSVVSILYTLFKMINELL